MATTSFRLMGFNILGVRFSSKVSWLLRRPRIVKRASRVLNDVDTDFASIYTFLECRQYEADYLKAELGWTDSLSSPLGCTIGIRGGWKFGKDKEGRNYTLCPKCKAVKTTKPTRT